MGLTMFAFLDLFPENAVFLTKVLIQCTAIIYTLVVGQCFKLLNPEDRHDRQKTETFRSISQQ